jgi:uncharacterized phage-associated protein
MRTDEFSCERLSKRIETIVGEVQNTLTRETGERYDYRVVEQAMTRCVASKIDQLDEDMLEMFTTPSRDEYQQLSRAVEKYAPVAKAVERVEDLAHLAMEFGDESVFEGHRPFSKARLAAMMAYLTAKGQHVYKTSLNKLLFYSDLTSFYLSGRGISGAVYYNRPFGPVADPAGPVLNELVRDEKVSVDPRMQTLVADSADEADELLTEDERKILDWVLETYGHMGAGEISELSHREMAYKYTEPNEPIAYAYGKFFKHLPPKDLLGH